jgi:hypothetical protein
MKNLVTLFLIVVLVPAVVVFAKTHSLPKSGFVLACKDCK